MDESRIKRDVDTLITRVFSNSTNTGDAMDIVRLIDTVIVAHTRALRESAPNSYDAKFHAQVIERVAKMLS